VRTDGNSEGGGTYTVFLVHFLDLPGISSSLDDIEIEFIPEETKDELWN
jgi:hypothetical protein